ncbi:MAG: MFS transporter [Ruminococcaceae bacterium]|nr:MFS transporter [Oscillospiraceae bacterium]
MKKFKLTPLEKSWVLYDIGNSAFVLLAATLLPIFFNGLASGAGISNEMYLSYWAYAGSIATALVAIIGPICGSLTNQKGFKKPVFVVSMLLGAVGCIALGIAKSWLLFLALFVVAKVGFSSSIVFYDSMLPEITTEDRMDNVSSKGYAYGYIGSCIPFLVCLALVLFYDKIGITLSTAMVLALVLTGVWWIVCSLPLLKNYRQTAYVERRKNAVGETFAELGRTLVHAFKHPKIILYLVAFFFFINGVYTIIDMATAYGTSLGLDTTGLLLALLVTQIVAFPFAILFGRLASKVRPGLLIKICILCYTGITVFAVFLVAQWQFWLLAVLVGMFQGAIQALSRSYLGKIIPAERSGSYYGLMDICGKGASFLGGLLIGIINEKTVGMSLSVFGIQLQSQNFAVSSLIVLFIIGFVLFCIADKLSLFSITDKLKDKLNDK